MLWIKLAAERYKGPLAPRREHVQAESTEENHDANMEEMRYSECETEEYTYHTRPAFNISCAPDLRNVRFLPAPVY